MSPLSPAAAAAVALTFLFAGSPSAQDCNDTTVGFIPLHDLADGTYQGFQGGLYPGGQLVRPAQHDADGLAQSARVIPRDAFGNPDPGGAIVLLSIGLSNTTQEFQEFLSLVQEDETLNPRLVIVDGAQGGQAAEDIQSLSAPYWSHVDEQLAEAGVTIDQVQVIWLKTANRAPSDPFPTSALTLRGHMTVIVRNIQTRFPFARLAYISSRIYAGYATTNLNPEPYAYESGFAVKWLIQDQIEGNPALNFDPSFGIPRAPWLAWGPYLWADGTTARSDLLTWECDEFAPDGTHPEASARLKVAHMLDDFFRTDGTAKTWYLADPRPFCEGQARTDKRGVEVGSSAGTVQLVASAAPTVPSARPIRAHAFGAPPLAPGQFVVARQPSASIGGSLRGQLLGGFHVIGTITDALGVANIVLGAIPPDTALCGEQLYVRFQVADPEAPEGRQLSRWLWLRAGH